MVEEPGTPQKYSLDWQRRQFLLRASIVCAGGAIAYLIWQKHNTSAAAQSQIANAHEDFGAIPQRMLGKTGVEVSALALGGAHLGNIKDDQVAVRIVQEAVDAGVNFLDNAWEYGKGRCEELMGQALQGGRRDKAFLMTKVCTHGRDARVAMQQLEQSLQRLKTDYIDLWQIHEVIYDNDPELHFAKGGVVEALEQAKQQGKVRFIGFTGHKDPAIHLKMLAYKYPFDTCQLPLNCFDASFRSFEQQVLPELNRQQIAAIGMKSLGGSGDALKKGIVTVEEALRYAMSLSVASTVSGIDSLAVLYQNLRIAGNFQPMSTEEMQGVRNQYANYAADGRFELYKTSKKYDGRPGREQHGFPLPQQLKL
ncbi:aldo/keto reductase [Gloeocapsopsis sp. IPPAS B-1203]|uniref:aldo/keto reductase n=1 Tax=Gloeocapsopsis sp. IPPAS B-1203 TaxID=2049454 RepID=UPI000C1791E4|nr:aldo/keto reductase [Gloeocapsopsis sp. IPPAS B-1203]PIG94719.1 aldo/keto reductase [Gloeocapsopsis sp. IPPAS B-1203]